MEMHHSTFLFVQVYLSHLQPRLYCYTLILKHTPQQSSSVPLHVKKVHCQFFVHTELDYFPKQLHVNQAIFLNRIFCHTTITTLWLMPQIAQIMVSITSRCIRKCFCELDCFIISFFIECDVILLSPIIWDVHQTHSLISNALLHKRFSLLKHTRF